MKLKLGFAMAAFAAISVLAGCSSYDKIVRDHYDNYLYTTPKVGPALKTPSNLSTPEQSTGRYPLPSDFKVVGSSNQADLSPPNILKK
ncbi:hypothetical protein [Piscirickettsia litoralis]|uniref:Lipoprotein n=1 Tax=Piscirickettsia litoralis TaxID=1891921 RepID=A0ABX3A6H9_9GAMM|nr:hypothetical protein [Piscirickettsia litoralis]ODN43837.1 hypothetical protein BGC07_14225 [Piscirickettsia litoralis]